MASNSHDALVNYLIDTGESVSLGANRPLVLDAEECVWVVLSGALDIFHVPFEKGVAAGTRRGICHIESGRLVFPIACSKGEPEYRFIAVAGPETNLVKSRLTDLVAAAKSPEQMGALAHAIDEWVVSISCGLTTDETLPRLYHKLELSKERVLEPSDALHVPRGVWWAAVVEGECCFLGNDNLPAKPGDVLPLCSYTWFEAREHARIICKSTVEVLSENGNFWPSMDRFHAVMVELARLKREALETRERERLTGRLEYERRLTGTALHKLSRVVNDVFEGADTTTGDGFLAACRMVGGALGIDIREPATGLAKQDAHERLLTMAKESRFRIRSVALQKNWWNGDHGPLLGFYQDTDVAVALLPAGMEHYDLCDPRHGSRARVDASIAAKLAPRAYMFYRIFPGETLNLKDLLRFGMQGCWKDMRWIVGMGAGAGLLSTAIPVATSILWDTIIPSANKTMLFQMVIGIFVCSVTAAIFSLVQGFAQLRLTGRMSAAVQAAVWDRLLDLPAVFYRRFASGDLSNRAFGIEAIHQVMSGTVLTSILSGVFCIFNLALLFHYGLELVPAALGIIVLAAVFMWACLFIQLRYQRAGLELGGKLQGLTFQLLVGIAKLRTCAAEMRAFHKWALKYAEQKTLSLKSRQVGIVQSIFNSSLPLATSLVVFAWLASGEDPQKSGMDTGKFLAFSAALTGVISSVLGTITSLSQVITIIPTYERTKPILEAKPEWSFGQSHPGQLSGLIEISHVNFRYKDDSPQIIWDVCINAEPGEFIALVGPSGSGKSTIFRLLIGFEIPESGSIYYDGQALADLDLQALRRQIGVVLQDGKLLSGSIYQNIVGASGLSMADAWEAARCAALDKDIEAMPMGMHTIIGEGGSGISGGQKQRLLIARAIIRKPRILLFDEATSALDNEAQAAVSESLEGLQATRIVIAHRLSTIRNADRIYVLVGGKVVESGQYDDLLSSNGVFSDLVKRQLA